jgi:hypothetical protein
VNIVRGVKKIYRKIIGKTENKILEKIGEKAPLYKGGFFYIRKLLWVNRKISGWGVK